MIEPVVRAQVIGNLIVRPHGPETPVEPLTHVELLFGLAGRQAAVGLPVQPPRAAAAGAESGEPAIAIADDQSALRFAMLGRDRAFVAVPLSVPVTWLGHRR